jgi:hypothetical protein
MAVGHEATGRSRRSGSSASSEGRASETKQAFKTTEFFAYVAAVVGVLIAAAAVGDGEGGGGDLFGARSAWLCVTILTVGYMVSRGLSKAGSREPSSDRSDA